jgi:hypothetical protein
MATSPGFPQPAAELVVAFLSPDEERDTIADERGWVIAAGHLPSTNCLHALGLQQFGVCDHLLTDILHAEGSIATVRMRSAM